MLGLLDFLPELIAAFLLFVFTSLFCNLLDFFRSLSCLYLDPLLELTVTVAGFNAVLIY